MTNENTNSEIGVAEPLPHHQVAFLSAENMLVLLTWTAFLLLLFILNKFAWKPILAGLDEREANIRKSVEDAEKIKAELEAIHQKRNEILSEAEAKAKGIVDQSRHAAIETANVIQNKAKEEAQILVQNAEREIKELTLKAKADLKNEAANISIQLSSKLIEENLDTEKNRKLVNHLIKDIA